MNEWAELPINALNGRDPSFPLNLPPSLSPSPESPSVRILILPLIPWCRTAADGGGGSLPLFLALSFLWALLSFHVYSPPLSSSSSSGYIGGNIVPSPLGGFPSTERNPLLPLFSLSSCRTKKTLPTSAPALDPSPRHCWLVGCQQRMGERFSGSIEAAAWEDEEEEEELEKKGWRRVTAAAKEVFFLGRCWGPKRRES